MSKISGRTTLRNTLYVVILLPLLTPFKALTIVLIAIAALAFLIHAAFVRDRRLGIAFISILGLASAYYIYWQVNTDLRYQYVLTQVNAYNKVEVECERFPFPSIMKLSIEQRVSDSELNEILDLDGLAEISEIDLESDELTDASLKLIATKFQLRRLFLDCKKITNAAILDFKKQFPDCTVVPYKRDLNDSDFEVFFGPPPFLE